MSRAYLPFLYFPSQSVIEILGVDTSRVAVLAMRAVLRDARTLEIAHQQIAWRTPSGGEFHLAFSTRIGTSGDLVMQLDLGDPQLSHRIVLEEEFQQAAKAARAANVRGVSRQR